jgi:hypothetical protein
MKITLENKECKSFINKLIKIINGIKVFNIDSIAMIQVIICNNMKMDIVFEIKPFKIDIFTFFKNYYIDNELYKEGLNEIDKEKIKIKRDYTENSPIIFSNINKTIDYCDNINNIWSNSYFIVLDYFKEFLDKKEIGKVSSELEFYDNNGNKYDTNGFIYENNVRQEWNNPIIKANSPEKYLPINKDEEYCDENDEFLPIIVKNILLKLNLICVEKENNSIRWEQQFSSNIIDDPDNIDEELVRKGEAIYTVNGEKIKIFKEFIKSKSKYIILDTNIEKLGDNIIRYVGLGIVNKENVIYIIYRYLETFNN